tara:strand:+ start:3661 stop:4119 length:459 start_codon:yes stop_codon:yes gene_type:complete
MGMGPGPAATARNKANKRETEFLLKDPKGYTAEKMAIRNANPVFDRAKLMGVSTRVGGRTPDKGVREAGFSMHYKSRVGSYSDKRLERDMVELNQRMDSKELLARQREEIKSRSQEETGLRMRAGIRNKTRRSLTQKDEKTGALGPMGSLGA